MLLLRAIFDVADDPDRVGSHSRTEIAPAARTYHLRHSRGRVQPPSERVRHPRHFLLFRICDDGHLEIGRVLHDGMDLKRHLPAEYRGSDAD